jgi:two-component system CheB/CheR fusion protein
MMSTLLTRSGFEVRTAADGLAAVALIDEFSPHVALVDVGLPGIDGFEVARRVRAEIKNQQVTLIALTGYGQQSDRATAIKAGFDAHLVKPVRLQQLLTMIASHERESGGLPSGPEAAGSG